MKVHIKRVDSSLPLPEYKTAGAAAFDLYARVDTSIKPGEVFIIPTNLIIKIPSAYVLILTARSSTHKKGLMPANGIGIIDADYCGDDDELGYLVYNFTKKPVRIKRGERIGQAMFVKLGRVQTWVERKRMNKKSRGGFGSTGVA